MTPAERVEEANGQAEGGGGEGQIAVTACHAAGGALVKQRRLDTAEAGGEDFTAGNTAGGGGFATTSGGAVGGVGVASTAGDAAGEGGVGVATAFDAVGGGGQTSLTSLL